MPNLFPNGIQGLSDSRWSGVAGSVAALIGINLHSTPGLIKVHQKLTKNSGATVDEFCKIAVSVSTGVQIWFSSTSGKIWEKDTSDVWTLVYTTAPGAGTAGCSGAKEFDGYIYWATQSRLHRMPVANLGSAANWTANAAANWATFTETDADFHPMALQNLQLFIGDANLIARVDNEGTAGAHQFTANALDLNAPHRVSALIDFDIDLLIGTFIHANVNTCHVYRWDTEDTSWMSDDAIDENGVNAFIRDDNYVYAQCGRAGRIYFYNGEQMAPFKRIPGDWSPTKTAQVYSQSVAMLLGTPVFGLSNLAGNPVNQGIYSFGSYSKDYNKILDLSFPISTGTLTSIEVGAIITEGANMYSAFKDGSSFGVDKLDYTAKYASATIETVMLSLGEARNFIKTTSKIFAHYASLPASTSITFSIRKYAGDSYRDLTSLDDTVLQQIRAEDSGPDIANLQIKIAFTVNSNDAPEVEDVGYSTGQSDEQL